MATRNDKTWALPCAMSLEPAWKRIKAIASEGLSPPHPASVYVCVCECSTVLKTCWMLKNKNVTSTTTACTRLNRYVRFLILFSPSSWRFINCSFCHFPLPLFLLRRFLLRGICNLMRKKERFNSVSRWRKRIAFAPITASINSLAIDHLFVGETQA